MSALGSPTEGRCPWVCAQQLVGKSSKDHGGGVVSGVTVKKSLNTHDMGLRVLLMLVMLEHIANLIHSISKRLNTGKMKVHFGEESGGWDGGMKLNRAVFVITNLPGYETKNRNMTPR